MGDLPLMTENGSFIINGAERVIVSQLVRSPGVYNASSKDKTGKEMFATTVMPNRGAWLELEQDAADACMSAWTERRSSVSRFFCARWASAPTER